MAAPDGGEVPERPSRDGQAVRVAFLAIVVAVWAMLFGFAYAPEAHGHEAAVVEHPAPANSEFDFVQGAGGGAEESVHGEQSEDGGATPGAIVSSILISLTAAALVPLALGSSTVGATATTVALLSIGAAVIHFAVIAQHFDEWWLTGTFFLVLAVFQIAWGLLVLMRPSRLAYLVGAGVNALVVVTWIVSRTTGVPVGPSAGEAEPAGLSDAVATAFEAVLVAILIALLSGWAARGPAGPLARIAGGVVVVTLTALALVSVA